MRVENEGRGKEEIRGTKRGKKECRKIRIKGGKTVKNKKVFNEKKPRKIIITEIPLTKKKYERR